MFKVIIAVVIMFALTTEMSFADSQDPETTISNFAKIITGVVTAFGSLVVIWGVVQVGTSVQSQDASSRTQGILAIVGGIIIAAAPWIVITIL
jgi:hypothetical protein